MIEKTFEEIYNENYEILFGENHFLIRKSQLKNFLEKLKETYNEEIKSNIEIIFDMLNQCCGNDDNNQIDNHCMSCYEEATEYLTKKGKLKEINKRMYEIIGEK
jgi:DNA-binding transcriptional regulator GbsR (MarR family)